MKANFRQPIHLPSNLTRIRVNGTLLSVAGLAAILAAIDLFVRLSGFFYRIFAIVELPEIFPISGGLANTDRLLHVLRDPHLLERSCVRSIVWPFSRCSTVLVIEPFESRSPGEDFFTGNRNEPILKIGGEPF
jgi:CBS domain containing-hemolysin-like protein